MFKILLTGSNGQVGWELNRTLQKVAKVVAFDHYGLDLAQPDLIRKLVREVKPDIIINAAAYTAVDRAESDVKIAESVNAVAPGILAEEAKRIDAILIHYSTDAVFDGKKRTPYSEDDSPNPINVYGLTKLSGEKAIEEVGLPHMIFRTSWIYGARGHNFMRTILKLSSERNSIDVVDDQIGAPTWSRLVAEVTTMIILRAICNNRGRLTLDFQSGIYNMSAGGQTSWYEFATAIIELVQSIEVQRAWFEGNKFAEVLPIPSSNYPLIAKRPLYSILDNQKIRDTFSIALPDWRKQLELCLSSETII